MMILKRVLGPASVLLLATCAPQLHVPGDVSGDVAVKLVNDTAETLCQIKLTASGESIVGGGGFFAHKDATIKLKPGAYDFYATSVGCGGSLTGTQRVDVQQATEVHFGGNHPAGAAAGVRVANVVMTGQGAVTTCQAQGFGCVLDSDCCSGLHCAQSNHSCM